MNLSNSDKPKIFISLIVLSSLAYVVGLAWNSFFEKLAKKYISTENTIIGYLIYAIIMTITLVIVALLATKLLPNLKK